MTITVAEAAQQYMALRDEKDRIKRERDTEIREIVKKMDVIEQWFTIKADKDGVDNWKTAFGTIYFSTVNSCSVADWDVVLHYAQEHDAYEILTKGVNKTAIKEYLDAGKELPPGVNWTTVSKMFARKPTTK